MDALITYLAKLPRINLILGIPLIIFTLTGWNILLFRWIRRIVQTRYLEER